MPLKNRAKRCEHGFYAGLCTERHCSHWDKVKTARDAKKTISHESHGKQRNRDRRWGNCDSCGRARKFLYEGKCTTCRVAEDSEEETQAKVVKSVIMEVVREARTVSVEKTG